MATFPVMLYQWSFLPPCVNPLCLVAGPALDCSQLWSSCLPLSWLYLLVFCMCVCCHVFIHAVMSFFHVIYFFRRSGGFHLQLYQPFLKNVNLVPPCSPWQPLGITLIWTDFNLLDTENTSAASSSINEVGYTLAPEIIGLSSCHSCLVSIQMQLGVALTNCPKVPIEHR